MQRSWILAFTAVAVLAACDDDPAASEGDPMSQAEALSIAGNVMLTGEAATTEGIVQATENGDDAGTIHFTQTTTHPCPAGGLVEISLDADVAYDQGAQSFTLDATGAVEHDGCGVNAQGAEVTLDGDPGLTLGVHAAAENGAPVGDWTSFVDGAFLWSADDGREGRCIIDLASTTDFTAQSRTISGEVCGHTIQQTLTWQ